MADTSGRNIIGARRVPSSALSEDYYTFLRSGAGPGSGPGTHHGSHSLRPAASRFSLRDQFATTRREIEFGFDDSSSILERSTIASEADPDNDFDDTVVVNSGGGIDSSSLMPPPRSFHKAPTHRSHYELLCLPRDTSLTPDEIRRAFHRVIQLLCVEGQPKRLQAAAATYLGQVQIAFETLIEPYRRAEYDLSQADESGRDIDTLSPGLSVTDEDATYQTSVLEQYMLLGPGGLRTTTDLGMRVDAASLFDPEGHRTRRGRGLGQGILDYSLRQSITTNLPALREPLEKSAIFLRDLAEKQLSLSPTKTPLHCADPTITITGSTHGLLDESFKLASLLRDPYQPPGPSIHGRRRLDQLISSRFLPMLNITTRQEIFRTSPPPTSSLLPRPPPTTVLEQELELLPLPSVTLRAGHTLTLPSIQEPLNLEISLQKHLTPLSPPTLGLALDQTLGPGSAFLVLDAGNLYPLSAPKECIQLSKFSQISQTHITTNIPNPFLNPPTIEAGYAFGSPAMGVRSARAFTRLSERGLRGMDHDCVIAKHTAAPSPSWTVSTGLTPGTAAAYLRYGRDMFTPFSWASTSSNPPTTTTPIKKPGFRAEVELAATTSSRRDILIAFRTLKYIGRFSKIGLELGVTASNLHLAVYWSRLGQRVSIPFLMSGMGRSTRLAFWTAVVPFLGMAVWEGVRGWRRGGNKQRGGGRMMGKGGDGEKIRGVEGDTMAEDIARCRAEADELTVILATGVEVRQRGERARGGLVVLSAKYGVMDGGVGVAEGENEIADVTVAVASIVDEEGRLRIPAGLDKGRLLGFWDPALGSSISGKKLVVRYLWRGKEGVVEVGEGEGVSLP